ncbi:MAG: hypothetical protein IPK07_13270 [Deltaproteobacteria bacterium]|nr:hypothetical protein [Deltaproteobacteria bacterium]
MRKVNIGPDVEVLPRRFDFVERGLSRVDAGVGVVGQAVFHGCIVTLSWPRAWAERLLPDGLALATPGGSDRPPNHPVVAIFGEQTQGATVFGGVPLPMNIRYPEFAIAIPFVQRPGSHRIQTFVPAMGSGYFPAIWHGNQFYGFSKARITIERRGSLVWMSGPTGGLWMHAAVAAETRWSRRRELEGTALDEIEAALRLPILGQRADGSLVQSWWDLAFRHSLVRVCSAWVAFEKAFVAGLPVGVHQAEPLHSVEVRGMLWQLSWPTRFDREA